MEVIKKRVCLESFTSRIPTLLETVNIGISDKIISNGSWGEMPKPVTLLNVEMRYGTMIDLYYALLSIVMNSNYLEYDKKGNKWIETNYDWRDFLVGEKEALYVSELPKEPLDRTIIALVSIENEHIFNKHMSNLFHSEINGINVISAIHELIGRVVIPPSFDSVFVPYMVFLYEVNDMIKHLTDLKKKTHICCLQKKYEDYGGDAFLDYLKSLPIPETVLSTCQTISATIDLPILLTSDLLDLGQYKKYDVEEVDTNGQIMQDMLDPVHVTPSIVMATGESKLRTLRKRKRSFDDFAQELPGIHTFGKTRLETPYQVKYIKNIQSQNGKFYGDLITSMREYFTSREMLPNEYYNLKEKAIIDKFGTGLEGYRAGTADAPIAGLKPSDVGMTITYGGVGNSLSKVRDFAYSDKNMRIQALVSQMCNILDSEYPEYYCYQQDYSFIYELTYQSGTDDEGNPIMNTLVEPFTDTVYVGFDKPRIEITYVLGARLRNSNGKLILDESSPYTLRDNEAWDGEGIWYKESYPLMKLCVQEFTINGQKDTYTFDIIDFSSQEITYKYNGIDFPRKNYILCNDIRYLSDTFHNYSDSLPVFRDEKMMGLSDTIMEKYDVVIDRGSSSAFERHLQLSDLKSWQDLENYRNGMFLNK